MTKLIKYLIVDVETGKWDWNKEPEHHSIAVPNMLNNLELRVFKLLSNVAKEIRQGMLQSSRNRYVSTKQIQEEILSSKQEIELHFIILGKFERKVMEKIETETKISPIMTLKKMDSPLKQRKTTVSHIYERLTNEEIFEKLEKARNNLEKSSEMLEICEECWENMITLDEKVLLKDMKKLNHKLKGITYKELHKSFFKIDDVTRGIINNGINLKVNLSDVLNKLVDFILRNLVKSVDNYRKSEESKLIDKAFQRLKELDIDEENIKNLLDIKISLEIEPLSEASLETCYKKVGEMHANINSKIFALKSLNHLKKYFPENLNEIIDNVIEQFYEIRKRFLKKGGIELEKEKSIEDRNIAELEIYCRVVEDFLLKAEVGEEYFYLNNKLHHLNNSLSSKYHVLDKEHLCSCLQIIGEEQFRSFVSNCEELTYNLRKEKTQDVVDVEDLTKVGIATGKTTMIDTFPKAVNVILASLGTFLANTLHTLIREMIQNIPIHMKERAKLEKTYKKVEKALRNLDQESHSESSQETLSESF